MQLDCSWVLAGSVWNFGGCGWKSRVTGGGLKRHNQVILDRQMSLRRIYAVQSALAVEAVLSTDLAALGAHHRMVCQSDLALETLAFTITALAHREPLHATVYGWLWSGGEWAHVVAHELLFHVPPPLREQAVNVLKQLRGAEGLPIAVTVNGWRVVLREALANVGIGGGLV